MYVLAFPFCSSDFGIRDNGNDDYNDDDDDDDDDDVDDDKNRVLSVAQLVLGFPVFTALGVAHLWWGL